MKIIVAGIGYVGLSNAVLLARNYDVIITDILPPKVDMINKRQSPIADTEIEDYLKNKKLSLTARLSDNFVYEGADYVIIATPTDYNSDTNLFNTQSVEKVIEAVRDCGCKADIVIRSTVPVGFTRSMNERYHTDNIIFAPEFLREGCALHDNLYPSRIVVGGKTEKAKKFADILAQSAIRADAPMLLTDSMEAEAIKLFSNAYLAMRISFINELDTFSEMNRLNSRQIIDGICFDPRIGGGYNNPSFGYGGYCFPKDTKQLKAMFQTIPNNIIKAIVDANATRKSYIADRILSFDATTIGIYRLTMKTGSDNFRDSSSLDIMRGLQSAGRDIVIYEPLLDTDEFEQCTVIKDLDFFKAKADLIVANRLTSDLDDISEKVYTRDIYGRD